MGATDALHRLLDGQPVEAALLQRTARRDPHPIYRTLRECDPVHRSPSGYWFLTRYGDVHDGLQRPDFEVARPDSMSIGGNVPSDEVAALHQAWLPFLNAPEHDEVRDVVAASFVPRRVDEVVARVEAITGDLVDALADEKAFDVRSQFATPLMTRVTCDLMGVPIELRDRWGDSLVRTLDPVQSPRSIADARVGARATMGIALDIVRQRACTRGTDVFSDLVHADPSVHTWSSAEEIVSVGSFLFGAAEETTTDLITKMLLHLLTDPDDRAACLADSLVMRRAADEVLRHDPPIHFTQRRPVTDVEIGGVEIPAGASILLALAGANRDPDVFDRPDEVDIRRSPNRHLSFSSGAHHCLGAALARRTATLAVTALLGALPELRLRDRPHWRGAFNTRRIHHLPVATP